MDDKPKKRGGKRPGAGRPVKIPNASTAEEKRAFSEVARQYADAALKTLVDVHKDTTAPPAARVSAASALLDRAYGKPPQALEHSGSIATPHEKALDELE